MREHSNFKIMHDAMDVLPLAQKEQESVPPADDFPAMHGAQPPHET